MKKFKINFKLVKYLATFFQTIVVKAYEESNEDYESIGKKVNDLISVITLYLTVKHCYGDKDELERMETMIREELAECLHLTKDNFVQGSEAKANV